LPGNLEAERTKFQLQNGASSSKIIGYFTADTLNTPVFSCKDNPRGRIAQPAVGEADCFCYYFVILALWRPFCLVENYQTSDLLRYTSVIYYSPY